MFSEEKINKPTIKLFEMNNYILKTTILYNILL